MKDFPKWTVIVRADGRSDVDAAHASRTLAVADLGGDVVRWTREPRSVVAEVIVQAIDEDAAYDTVIRLMTSALDETWIVSRTSELPR